MLIGLRSSITEGTQDDIDQSYYSMRKGVVNDYVQDVDGTVAMTFDFTEYLKQLLDERVMYKKFEDIYQLINKEVASE